jgi:hypothetical protein
MLHFSGRAHWNEDCRVHRLHPHNVQADTQLLDFGGKRAVELTVEIGLAVELWRVRGCPEEGLVADMKLAKKIVQAGAWSA